MTQPGAGGRYGGMGSRIALLVAVLVVVFAVATIYTYLQGRGQQVARERIVDYHMATMILCDRLVADLAHFGVQELGPDRDMRADLHLNVQIHGHVALSQIEELVGEIVTLQQRFGDPDFARTVERLQRQTLSDALATSQAPGHNRSTRSLRRTADQLDRLHQTAHRAVLNGLTAGRDASARQLTVFLSVLFALGAAVVAGVLSSIARTVAERDRAEVALRQQAQIVDQMRDTVITADPDGYVTSWNAGAERMLGYSAAEALNRHITFIYPEDQKKLLNSEVLAPLADTGEYNGEVRMRRKSGDVFHAYLSLGLLHDAAGNEVGRVGYSLDITDRKLVEEALRTSEASLLNAQEIAQLGSFDWDLINGRFQWSAEIYRSLGASPETLGPSLADYMAFVHPEDRAGVLQKAEQMVQESTGARLQLEYRIVRSNGEVRVVVGQGVTTFDGAGTAVRVMGTIQDITERKAAERELAEYRVSLESRVRARTHELAAVNSELQAFAYSVTHDLRAPLRAMDGFSAALLEDYVDRLDDTGRHYLTRIRAGAGRMDRLITDILELSRITRRQLHTVDMDLSRLAEAIIAQLQESDPEPPVAWHIEPGLHAQADPRLMEIVLTNLLSNARKFSSRTAHPQVCLRRETTEGGEPAFVVVDNGAGFDMAHADKLFVAFQRLHNESEFPGTGVGLATVQRIIHKHGGRIWAESRPGHGARFAFTLGGARTAHDA